MIEGGNGVVNKARSPALQPLLVLLALLAACFQDCLPPQHHLHHPLHCLSYTVFSLLPCYQEKCRD